MTTAATAPTATPQPGTPSAQERRRRWRWPGFVILAVVAVSLVSASLLRTATRSDLDPRSAAPDGSRAVAEILRRQGVRVDLVTRSDAAVDGTDADTTVVVLQPWLLGPGQIRRLRDSPADLVLVEPDLPVLTELELPLTPTGVTPPRPATPACSDPDAVAADGVTGGGHLYTVTPRYTVTRRPGQPTAGTDLAACYPDARHPERVAVVRVTTDGRRMTVLGQRALLQNETLVNDGNAALALRVLGAHPQLRWYLPDPTELDRSAAPTLRDLLPPWLRWAVLQLGIVTVVAMLWRGRRFARVVTEPLPVVVRSAETVEGRARLYRTGRARGHAATVLRTASARRLAHRLGVPAHATPGDVVQLAAATTGRDPTAVHDLLLGPPPRDDAALVALAGALDELEHAVATPPAPGSPVGGPHYAERLDGEHGNGEARS